MNTRHPLSGIRTYISGMSRVIDCPWCKWQSRTRRGNALAMAAILVGELSKHVRQHRPEDWVRCGGRQAGLTKGQEGALPLPS